MQLTASDSSCEGIMKKLMNWNNTVIIRASECTNSSSVELK